MDSHAFGAKRSKFHLISRLRSHRGLIYMYYFSMNFTLLFHTLAVQIWFQQTNHSNGKKEFNIANRTNNLPNLNMKYLGTNLEWRKNWWWKDEFCMLVCRAPREDTRQTLMFLVCHPMAHGEQKFLLCGFKLTHDKGLGTCHPHAPLRRAACGA